MVADIGEGADRDNLPCGAGAPAAHAPDDGVRREISMSSVRVASGTVASAACLTIGASVPSISSRIAERAGFERICPSASTSVSAGTRCLVWRALWPVRPHVRVVAELPPAPGSCGSG